MLLWRAYKRWGQKSRSIELLEIANQYQRAGLQFPEGLDDEIHHALADEKAELAQQKIDDEREIVRQPKMKQHKRDCCLNSGKTLDYLR